MDIITDAIKSGDYELVKETNRKVASLIEQYARSHSVIDASIGIMGWLPVPGASLASLATSFATQIPVIKSLVFEIGRLYRPSETHNLAVETDELAKQFGFDFFVAIKSELAAELGMSIAASWIPLIGSFLLAGMDLSLGITMKWRAGVMASIFYQNGGKWVGSREETYQLAKKMTGTLSPKFDYRVDLNQIPILNGVCEVMEAQIQNAVTFVGSLREVNESISDEKLHEMLIARGFPEALATAAIVRAVPRAKASNAQPQADNEQKEQAPPPHRTRPTTPRGNRRRGSRGTS